MIKHNSKIVNKLKIQRDISLLVLFIILVCVVGHYIARRQLISPIPDNPIISTVKASDCDPKSKDCIISKSKHPAQIYHIWKKETTFGTNTNPHALHNVCKSKGMSNEFGFGGMQNMWCYKDFQEATDVVDAWLTKRDNENLCYYNLGIRKDGCEYVK